MPYIALKMSNCAVIGVYNQHTSMAYTGFGKNMSKNRMFEEFVGAMDEAITKCGRKKGIVVGDVNMNWRTNDQGTMNWAERNRLEQWVIKPTRMNTLLDQVYTLGITPRKVEVIDYAMSDHKGVEVVIGKARAEKRRISYLQLRVENVQTINLQRRSFVATQEYLEGMLYELRMYQESLRVSKMIRAGGAPKWSWDPQLRALRTKIIESRQGEENHSDTKAMSVQYRRLARNMASEEQQTVTRKNTSKNVCAAVREHRSKKLTISGDDNGHSITDDKELAEVFKAELLQRNVPQTSDESNVPGLVAAAKSELRAPHAWRLKYVTPMEVAQIITTLKNSKLAGRDMIQMDFIKAVKDKVAHNMA